MHPARTVAITGASGLIGSALVDSFEADGWRVLRLVRGTPRAENEVAWRPEQGEIDSGALERLDAFVHLAGKNIATERWTDKVKQQIADSRVQGTQLVSHALAQLEHKPGVLVCASAIGFYGDRPGEVLDEESPAGEGFLPDTCQQWEQACRPAWEAGIRVVQMRIGVVLSEHGGMLKSLLPIFNKGLGGPVGSGEQMISWIERSDLVRAIRFVIDHEAMHGAVNGTAPVPVTNRAFAKAFAAQIGKPAFLPTPAFAVKLAKGEMGEALALEGADIRPRRLLDAGFDFDSPELGAALKRALG